MVRGAAGAVGLGLADILGGFAESAPRTVICKFLIGMIVGLIAHSIGNINGKKNRPAVIRLTVISTLAGLLFNCIFEPSLKYIWYTLLVSNADKAESAIKAGVIALSPYQDIEKTK